MNKRPGGGSWNRRSNPSSKDIPGMRRQRSLEWRNDRDSSSDDEIARPVESQIFASLLVQARKEFKDEMQRNYGLDAPDEAVTTENHTTPFPNAATCIISPRSPIPLHRQASPFPLENINQPRRINYQHQTERLRNITVPGEVIYASGNKKAISNNVVASTLGRSSGAAAGRRHRIGGMTSSSSATSCNSSTGNDNIMQPNGDVPYHHVEKHARRLSNDVADDSPPEPAPPEIPPRGGSLHSTTLRRKAEFQLLSNGEVLTCEDPPYHQAGIYVKIIRKMGRAIKGRGKKEARQNDVRDKRAPDKRTCDTKDEEKKDEGGSVQQTQQMQQTPRVRPIDPVGTVQPYLKT